MNRFELKTALAGLPLIGIMTAPLASAVFADSFTEVPMTEAAWHGPSESTMSFVEHGGRTAMRLDGVAFVDELSLE